MKKNLLLLIAFAVLCGSAFSQQVTLKTAIYSKYLAKPGILFYNGPVSVNEINVSYKDFYVNLWSSTSLGQDPLLGDYGDEVDFGLGWRHAFKYMRLDVRGSYFMLGKLGQTYDDRWILDARIDFIKCPIIEPYVAVRYNGNVTTRIVDGGWFAWAGIKRKQPLWFSFGTKEPVSLTADISVMYSDGALHREAGIIYGRGSLCLDIPLRENLIFSPSVLYQLPSGDQTGFPGDYAAKPEVVWGAALKFSF